MSNAPQPLTTNQLERLLQQRNEIAARPRQTPREVFAKWLDNLGVGLGAGIAAAVALWFLRAPDTVLLSAPVALGLLVFAVMMAWRGSLDELSDWRNERAVRREVTGLRAGYEAEAAKLRRQLEAAYDAIEELEDTIDRLTFDRDTAISELSRERQAARTMERDTFVPAEAPPENDAKDAGEMVRWRYQFGSHLSRDAANHKKQWSQTRWKAAQQVLVDAGVIAVVNGVTQYPPTMDEAFTRLGTYMLRARKMAAPAINNTLGVMLYVESKNA